MLSIYFSSYFFLFILVYEIINCQIICGKRKAKDSMDRTVHRCQDRKRLMGIMFTWGQQQPETTQQHLPTIFKHVEEKSQKNHTELYVISHQYRCRFYLPTSHVTPVKPNGDVLQSHKQDVPNVSQEPPFLQGFEMQGLGAEMKKKEF